MNNSIFICTLLFINAMINSISYRNMNEMVGNNATLQLAE